MKPHKTKKIGHLIGTLNELADALRAIEMAYPNLRWCDEDPLIEGLEDLGCQFGESKTLIVELGDRVSYLLTDSAGAIDLEPGFFSFAANSDESLALARKVYGAPKPEQTVTLKWLRDKHACAEGREWFAKNFGRFAEVPAATLRKLLADNPFWIQWLDNHIREN